jgi:hypothetical protein
MPYPIGLDRMIDKTTGQIIGTQPIDMQRWIWSLYRADAPTIARGLEVVGTSVMAYEVKAGIGIIPTGSSLAIAVPYDTVRVPTPDAPSSGSRTDYVYADRDGAIFVGTSQPAGTILLDKRKVPANISATTATTSQLGERKNAPLFGTNMGRIALWESGQADQARVPQARELCTTKTFTLPGDRRLQFTMQQSYELERVANTSGENNWKRGSFVWEYWIDGKRRLSIELGVSDFPETKTHVWEVDLTAGTHTVQLYREQRLNGTTGDRTIHRRGGAEQWPGTALRVSDIGGTQ